MLMSVLWFLFCGVWMAAFWLLLGIVYSLSYIGLPIGIKCFRMAKLALDPFGKEVHTVSGSGSTMLNIVWLVLGGGLLAGFCGLLGLIMTATYIGAPFGRECFKIAGIALAPMGVEPFSYGRYDLNPRFR